jgi:hypothetical protein
MRSLKRSSNVLGSGYHPSRRTYIRIFIAINRGLVRCNDVLKRRRRSNIEASG